MSLSTMTGNRRRGQIVTAAAAAAALLAGAATIEAGGEAPARTPALRIGAAHVDITPLHPVRLSGFGFRRRESEGVTQHIFAGALAIDDGEHGPALLIAAENLGLSRAHVEEIGRRIERRSEGFDRRRLAVTATHTHTAPMLTGVCPTLFGEPIPREHLERIDRYTRFLIGRLVEAGAAALEDLEPGSLAWGQGTFDLARNRRTSGGPVDHALPVLVARGAGGAVKAIVTSYACHCVTLSDDLVSGDWAGFARAAIETRHPGAIALISIGCGGDQNPGSGVTGGRHDICAAQGTALAGAVESVIAAGLRPVRGPLVVGRRLLRLPLDELPSRDEWEERAKRAGAVGYHARVQLARLHRGEKLATAIDYPVVTWTFGEDLAMVFLAGEVVADYSLRLRRELDPSRVWINAYSNHSPCYIPSERILREGGYEGGGAMIYYDVPVRLRPGLEDVIVGAVHALLGPAFRARAPGAPLDAADAARRDEAR